MTMKINSIKTIVLEKMSSEIHSLSYCPCYSTCSLILKFAIGKNREIKNYNEYILATKRNTTTKFDTAWKHN